MSQIVPNNLALVKQATAYLNSETTCSGDIYEFDSNVVPQEEQGLFQAVLDIGIEHYSAQRLGVHKKHARHLANLFAIAANDSEFHDYLINTDSPLEYSLNNSQDTLSREEARIESAKCYSCAKPPCQEKKGKPTCKADNPIKEVLEKVMQGDFDSAYELLYQKNPTFELTCGGCRNGQSQNNYCQSTCTSNQENESKGIPSVNINIPDISRAIAKYASIGSTEIILPTQLGKQVALVGGGPSSLRCAIELAKNGIQATVYESRSVGGVMVLEKPKDHQDMGVYTRVIDRAKSFGVKFVSKHIGSEELEQLLNRNDAVYLGVGKTRPMITKDAVTVGGINWIVENDSSSGIGVTNSKEFRAYLSKFGILPNEKIVITDSGWTAIDIATTLADLGHKFSVLCYGGQTRAGDKNWQEQLAKHDLDISKYLLRNMFPVRLKRDAFGVEKIICGATRTTDSRLDFADDEISVKQTINIPCTFLIHSEGSIAERTFEDFVNYNGENRVVVDNNCQTSNPKIFAGGDACTHELNENDLCSANATGRIAAQSIIQMLALDLGLERADQKKVI